MNLKDKKILVTGARGFVGSAVVRKLLEHGVPGENISAPAAEECDLRKPEECIRAVAGRDIVIHLAAITGGGELHRDHPGSVFYDNLKMGMELMEASRLAGVEKFVCIGSATEYPANIQMPMKEEDLWGGYPDALHAPYALAKKALLVQGQAYSKEYGMDVVHLLPNNMYGPGQSTEHGVVPSLIKRFMEAKKSGVASIPVWGTGKAMREFLYVDDAAEGIVLMAESYDKPEPVNLGSGMEIPIKQVAETLQKLIGYGGKLEWDASKPEGVLRRVVDTVKAEREFGFKARTTFDEGIKKTVDWYIRSYEQ